MKHYLYAEQIEPDIARVNLKRKLLLVDLEGKQSTIDLFEPGSVERRRAEEEMVKSNKQLDHLEKKRLESLKRTLAAMNTVPLNLGAETVNDVVTQKPN